MASKKKVVDTRPVASVTAGIGIMGPRITVMLDRTTDWDRMTALGDAIADVLMKEGFRIGLEHEVTNA